MLNQMSILKSEKLLARIIADRDEIIEGLASQIDQLSAQADQLRKELHQLNAAKKDGTACQSPEPSPQM